MDWQILFTTCAVGLAGIYIARRGWQALKPGCSGGCGCAKTKTAVAPAEVVLIAPERLVMRAKNSDAVGESFGKS